MCASKIFGGGPKAVSVPPVITTPENDPEAERRLIERRRATAAEASRASSRNTVFTGGMGDSSAASLLRATLG